MDIRNIQPTDCPDDSGPHTINELTPDEQLVVYAYRHWYYTLTGPEKRQIASLPQPLRGDVIYKLVFDYISRLAANNG